MLQPNVFTADVGMILTADGSEPICTVTDVRLTAARTRSEQTIVDFVLATDVGTDLLQRPSPHFQLVVENRRLSIMITGVSDQNRVMALVTNPG